MRSFVSALALFVLAGCYVYVPIGTQVPDPGARLEVRLTDVGADTLAPLIGDNVSSVRGNLVSGNQDALVLAIKSVLLRSGDERLWSGEHVMLPRPTIAIVSERRLSRWRTGLTTGLAMLGSVALVASLNGGGVEGRPGGGGPGQTK
jgi:hypothetical protein